jgi:hypothetical protein
LTLLNELPKPSIDDGRRWLLNRGRALRDTRDDLAKCAVHRNDCFTTVPAFAGGEHDRVIADMRPSHAN